ncbi:MAG: hypothetical protein Tsb0014_05930 [Pleurocapsa sp.]
MFLSELSPILQNLLQQPVAFTSGFVSGMLKLKMDEQPLSTWLAKQGYTPTDFDRAGSNNSNKPQSIEIE